MTEAIVIGSGPNGLAAAITIARAGRPVRVYEAQPTIGGGIRSAELTEPGCVHDTCATVFALALASPFFKGVPFAELGVEFAHPDAPFAHPLDDGTAVVVERSVAATAEALDRADAAAYRRIFEPLTVRASGVMEAVLAPPGRRHPWLFASFAPRAVRSAAGFANAHFRGERARALFAGAAAHSMVPLEYLATAGYGLGLILSAHALGWPVVRGGSQRAADALAVYLRSLGGEIVEDTRVDSLASLPDARAILCDVTPRQLLQLAGDRVPPGYRRRLERFRYGPGVFKMDWALTDPVPWRAAGCRRAGTIHLGGTFDEIAASERASWRGDVPTRPYMIAVQATLCDPSRAPKGRHTLWAYCHVPHGCDVDMTDAMERQIERFAPGFRDCISTRHVMNPAALERRNANLVGGDIAGGASDFAQVIARPVLSLHPYATPMDGVYLCSSSTPPGVGVHGMCGYFAAAAALRTWS